MMEFFIAVYLVCLLIGFLEYLFRKRPPKTTPTPPPFMPGMLGLAGQLEKGLYTSPSPFPQQKNFGNEITPEMLEILNRAVEAKGAIVAGGFDKGIDSWPDYDDETFPDWKPTPKKKVKKKTKTKKKVKNKK